MSCNTSDDHLLHDVANVVHDHNGKKCKSDSTEEIERVGTDDKGMIDGIADEQRDEHLAQREHDDPYHTDYEQAPVGVDELPEPAHHYPVERGAEHLLLVGDLRPNYGEPWRCLVR